MGDPVAFMSRHFVAMVCEYETIDEKGTVETQDPAVLSGFLIELHGVLFWVTAGHCLKKLEDGMAQGALRILGGSLMDNFGLEAPHHEAIPYTYEQGSGLYIEQPEHGMDFALIVMDSLKAMAFAKNGLTPITRDNWKYQSKLTFDFYRILGIPEDHVTTTVRPDGTPDTQVRQAMVAVNEIGIDEIGETPHNNEWIPSDDSFIGRLDPGCDIPDMAGMSGGPIYGFRKDKDGNLLYHVVALQSRWWNVSRTIFGCSVVEFAELVREHLEAVITSEGN